MQLPPSAPSLTSIAPLNNTQQKTEAPSLNESFSALKNMLPKDMKVPGPHEDNRSEDTTVITGLTKDINDIDTDEHDDVTQTHIIEDALKYIQFMKEHEVQLQKAKEALHLQMKGLVESGIEEPEAWFAEWVKV